MHYIRLLTRISAGLLLLVLCLSSSGCAGLLEANATPVGDSPQTASVNPQPADAGHPPAATDNPGTESPESLNPQENPEKESLTEQPMKRTPFIVQKGINISHWLSQVFAENHDAAAFFTERDVITLKYLGFDHIRFPIDEEEMWNEDGAPIEESFTLLENALMWARRHDLRAIVDLHIIRSHHFNAGNSEGQNILFEDKASQDRLVELWLELSDRLRHHSPSWVAYEILNETVAPENEQWNELSHRVIAALREKEPERVIVLGSNLWQMTKTFPELTVPEGDPNILLSFHFYEPGHLTHYKAPWVGFGKYEGPVNYPGVLVAEEDFQAAPESLQEHLKDARGAVYDKEVLRQSMLVAKRRAIELNLPLYCGEFGCYEDTPPQLAVRWYKDVMELFTEEGIAWAHWDYRSDSFGILSEDGLKLDWDLINLLIQ